MEINMIGTIASVLLGGGILGFIQFLISRHDKKNDRMNEVLDAIGDLKTEVSEIKADAQEQKAITARTHILRFADELYNNVNHGREYFEQTLDDIETYEKYCDTHRDFKNGRTKRAVPYIKETYNRLIEEHKL